MKHKKDTNSVKSVNRPTKSMTTNLVKRQSNDAEKVAKEVSGCHQDIVKRLMTHSQYFPSNTKPLLYAINNPNATIMPTYQPPGINQSYQTYEKQPPQVYGDNVPMDNFSYYQPQLNYSQFPISNINVQQATTLTCLSPSLSSPSERSDYIFNGDFSMNFNTEFDSESFPLIDAGVNIAQQLSPAIKSETHLNEIKNTFEHLKNNNDATASFNFPDDEIFSSPSVTLSWKCV